MRALDVYRDFQAKADRLKDDLLTFLLQQKRAGATVAAYGAAAKGNTLLNYAGVKPDLLPFVCATRQPPSKASSCRQSHPNSAAGRAWRNGVPTFC